MSSGIRTGLAWLSIWAVFWTVAAVANQPASPGSIVPDEHLAPVGVREVAAFPTLLACAHDGRRIAGVALGRAARRGLLASALPPLMVGKPDQMLPFGMAGAAIETVVVAAARRVARG